ncbi:rhodanese-like domain-containing protein [Halodesulfovibrio marinisediminis]|uniref:Rhodanese-related sulfurtransferase n=1 Tax=Halodesulfovibrio marinisediminis DSM 17456 TaxID=1121457 RepID=A0A1N6J6M1_9BACT|nr:rhodanese-like domain-containing protein [Halodesulfovibrio marinisediminis]SIO39873.1 Rhodanese-related sulfurtransferase [Halodesulfovibrio marinisediminis DSM 17456]
MKKEYQDLTVAEVREFMAKTRENEYQLVDVRFLDEYEEDHLAGAILLPVDEIEERISELSSTKDTIVYCLSGRRSVAASVFIGTHPDFKGKVYNMLGGYLEWDGHYIEDMPNLKVFDMEGSDADLLYQAMNLEKGAHKFYELVLEKFPNAPFTPVMEKLVKAEEAHAHMIYKFWEKLQDNPPSFEIVYEGLPGDILEGGLNFDELAAKLMQEGTECQNVIEMAITIEFSAYDLYRNMAHLYKDTEMEKHFLSLCQSEKEHMRIAADALHHCR